MLTYCNQNTYKLRSLFVPMDDLTLIKRLEASSSAVFTSQQLAVLWRMPPTVSRVRAVRMVSRSVLVRINRGRYCLPSAPILSVASGLVEPSYVSLLAALEFHGATTQSTGIIDVINPVRSGGVNVELEEGPFTIRMIRLAPDLVFGYSREDIGGTVARIAELERAVVDGLLLPGRMGLDEVVSGIRHGLHPGRALEMAVTTGRQVVVKRLGYLLSREGFKVSTNGLQLSRTYVPLDPRLPRRGTHDPVWRVIVNRVIE